MNELKVQINGEDRIVPTGVELLGEVDLYSVNFSLLKLPDPEDQEEVYKWFNPRRLGRKGKSEGAGLDKVDMESLANDIKEEGLMSPLICRWVFKDGNLIIQVLDGERRFSCIDGLIESNDKVYCRGQKKWRPAKEVYKTVPCRIVTGNDKEALKIAFMVSNRSVTWGEAAVAKLIKKLRSCGCNDEEILDTTKMSSQWLREQDRICDLDELTFGYLSDGKINRALALILADIEDLDCRHVHLRAAYDDALAAHKEVIEKAEAALDRAETKEELAEAEVDEAKALGKDVDAAEAKLEEAQEHTEQKRQARVAAGNVQAKTKNFRRSARKVAAAAAASGQPVSDDVGKILSPGAIQKQLETIQEAIAAGGKDEEGKTILDLPVLLGCDVCYKAILHGDEDVIRLLRRHRAAAILTQRRATMKAIGAEAEIDEEVNDEAEEAEEAAILDKSEE